ncbi:hypothetical protein V6N12_042896 [Hibiscus sabdariffa]|uniref:DUF7745 domain-containing protein n=1 Tax=Hibiscus sabdariffa TaxID=183260 RepID=A0ABR2BG51_9ROSI
MGDVFRSTDEKNSDVQIWSEGEQQVDGDSSVDSWGREMKDTFKTDYGDIAYLLSVPVDEPLIQTLARFWNPAYTCFTFGNIDLVPTIEEYLALIHFPKIDDGRVYSKPKQNKSFRGKLRRISKALPSWVESQVVMKNEREYLKWEGMLTLATASPGGKVQRDMLALLIYGLVLFPKALGCIDIAVLDLFDRLDEGVNPVPVILAKTFRSLKFCRRNGGGRFQGCPQLLTIWFYSHLWTNAKLSRPLYDHRLLLIQEFLRKEDWPFGRTEEVWFDVLQNLKDDDLVWRAPWLQTRNVLYRCGEHSWVPLLGLWGHLVYAPLLVLRQYGSTQFVPATKGLKDFHVNYETDKSYKVAVHNASVAWNHIRRVRIFSAPYPMTPEYEVWRFQRLNDRVPNMNPEGTQSVQERLAILPREVDLIREQLEQEQEQRHKLEKKFEQERSDFRLEQIKHDGKVASLQKRNDELTQELALEKEEIRRLERQVKKKRAIEGVANEELISRIKEEKRRAENYKHQYLKHKAQVEALTCQLKELHASASEERERERFQDERTRAQLRQMERSVRRLRSATQAIWAQEQDMAYLMTQVRGVAQQLQGLAQEAADLQGYIGGNTEAAQRMMWVMEEIKKLGARVAPYA